MKNGTFYAKRVKRLFTKLKQAFGRPAVPDHCEPLEQLIIGLLSVGTTRGRAERAARHLFETTIDPNDIRVSRAHELASILRGYVPDAQTRAEAIRIALNSVFLAFHGITLDPLRTLGRREARQRLEGLEGVDLHTAASVMLWSLGGHAIPVAERWLETLRKEELVEPSATIEEVQAFLERNVAASDAKEFVLLMDKFVSSRDSRTNPGGTKKARSKTKSGPVKKARAETKTSSAKRTRAKRKSATTPSRKKKTSGAKPSRKSARRAASN